MPTPPSAHALFSASSQSLVETTVAANTSINTNQSQNDGRLPGEMTFNEDSLFSVIAYSSLFVIAAFGNLTVFITLFRNRHRKSRVNLFIMHLAIADLIVTFVMMPIETGWHITVSWRAGDVGCRILMFCRAFGFYLSSFILVVISVDRYFAIIHPMSLNEADQRGKVMLGFAWLFSVVSSIPQSVIFHVDRHPHYRWFTQCVTFNFFPTAAHEFAYNLFNIITVYGLPLLIITVTYTLILCEMSRKTREHRELSLQGCDINFARGRMRRSAIGNIQKARIRTLKMTIVIVLAFVVCWTPYYVMLAWWWFDRNSASKINPKVQRGLFIFAVSNSCMDPIVYGMFSIDFIDEFRRCCCCLGLPVRSRALASSQQVHFRRSTLAPSTSGSIRNHVIFSKREHCEVLETLIRNGSGSIPKSNSSVKESPHVSDRTAMNDFTRTSFTIHDL